MGRDKLRLEHVANDKKKAGTLRAGNSGILTEQGEFAGCCPHATHLRQLGIEIEIPTPDKLIMFQMGVESENAVFRDLEASLPEGQVLLREEETAIEWETNNGTRVTGRPDGVIYSAQQEVVRVGDRVVKTNTNLSPLYGIELKTVASFYTTKEVLLEGEPKLTALIQAAHYAWQLGVPYKLSYKNYVNQTVPGFKWVQPLLQGVPEWAREHINYKGDYAIGIKPFETVFELDFDEQGYCWYRREGDKVWTKSIIRWQDIRRYYEFISLIPETHKLGSKLHTVGVTGKKKSYSHCDQYCPIHQGFSQYEHDYFLWLSKIIEAATQGKLSKNQE
jgi:hypothetical protein